MSNEQQFVIIVRFSGWSLKDEIGSGKTLDYPPYGIKYLLTMPVIPYPEWAEDDERWFNYSEEKIVADEFKRAFEAKIKKPFDGDILFIEPANYVSLEVKELSSNEQAS